jgi:hypothetical protein
VKAAAKRWSYTAKHLKKRSWSDIEVLNASGNFVIRLDLSVRGFTSIGKKKWQRDFPRDRTSGSSNRHSAELIQTAGVLIMSYRHPARTIRAETGPLVTNVIEALDPATGRTLWKTVIPPFVTVLDSTVYTALCRAQQTGRRDECMLSAREAQTGRVLWTIPTEHMPYIVDGDGTTLAMGTRPEGYGGKYWLTALDKRTGARLGLRVDARRFAGGRPVKGDYFSDTYVADGRVILVTSRINQQAENCDVTEAARDVRTGKRVWHAAWQDPGCEYGQRWEGSSLPRVTGDGTLTLRDPATGKVTWKAEQPGSTILTADGGNVLVSSDEVLTLYGKARTWTLHAGKTRSFLTKERVLPTYSDATLAYDVGTGEPLGEAKGSSAGLGDGWVATTTTDHDNEKTIITVYRL